MQKVLGVALGSDLGVRTAFLILGFICAPELGKVLRGDFPLIMGHPEMFPQGLCAETEGIPEMFPCPSCKERPCEEESGPV